MRALSDEQRNRITWMMIAERLLCVTCGSVRLVCGDVVRETIGNYNVDVFCNDPDHPDEAPRRQPSFSFPLEDGPRVGLR